MKRSIGKLHSSRLRLRPLGPDDLSDLHAHWSEPEVHRYLWDGRVVSEEEVRGAIAESERLFEAHGVGLWVITPIESTELIGCGGYWYFHEPPELELVLSLAAHRWGVGLAQEAAGVLLDYVFNELGWETVQASTDAPNERSLRLMRRLGMRPVGERPGKFGKTEVFRLAVSEWSGRPVDVGGSA